ncbi:helix-turn-helix domain-containing protein [Micromonospora globispora]|nr:helix-turn-helix domain-containing protein [Micromonospora globispora]
MVVQAYRFALDLTPGQERAVLAHAGAARVAYNWALAWPGPGVGEWTSPLRARRSARAGGRWA